MSIWSILWIIIFANHHISITNHGIHIRQTVYKNLTSLTKNKLGKCINQYMNKLVLSGHPDSFYSFCDILRSNSGANECYNGNPNK